MLQLILILSIISINIIAKKVAKAIVDPVKQTFEKQKQFISDASHELKTPLAVIEANAEVLLNEMGTNKWLNYIQNEVDSMDKLINELLLLAQIENVDNLREVEQFNLSKEVEMNFSMFEVMAYEKQVSLKSEIAENIFLNGNKKDIEHIASNLIDNAIKHAKNIHQKEQSDLGMININKNKDFKQKDLADLGMININKNKDFKQMPECKGFENEILEKQVIVILKKEKNDIILEVKNTGDPVPDDEKEKIFERFYRMDKSRNRNDKRYGLGLAIVKSIIEKYNGKISVFYKEPFTIFKISIPN